MRRRAPAMRTRARRSCVVRNAALLTTALLVSTLAGPSAADGAALVVYPTRKPGPCTDLADVRADPKVTLSEHVVIDAAGLRKIEQEYPMIASPPDAWRAMKSHLRDGDEMFYLEYDDAEAEYSESDWYFFRDGCAIAVIPWTVS